MVELEDMITDMITDMVTDTVMVTDMVTVMMMEKRKKMTMIIKILNNPDMMIIMKNMDMIHTDRKHMDMVTVMEAEAMDIHTKTKKT